MRLDRDRSAGGPIVRGLGPAGFRLDEATTLRAALLTVERALSWDPPPLAGLSCDALSTILDPRPEFVLIGTGATLARPPRALVEGLEADGIGVEAMDSRAAARAWGVLRGEGRIIAAALYPLG